MLTFVATIESESILAFRSTDAASARTYLDRALNDPTHELCFLIAYERVAEDGITTSLWDGEAPVGVRLATAGEHAEWTKRRDESWSDDGARDVGWDDAFHVFLVPVRDPSTK